MEYNSKRPLFRSRYFFLWSIAVIIACTGIPFIRSISLSFLYVIESTVIVYLISGFTLVRYEFYSDYFTQNFPLFFKSRRFKYNSLYCLEIRNIKAPYQQPYVIIHFNKARMNSWNFFLRSFVYKDMNELSSLIELCKNQKVTVYTNIDSTSN